MSAAEGYRILDEPRPGPLSRFAVDPIWPLFGMMFAGGWFAWLWYVFNGFAVGSPTRKKEAVVAAIGLAGLVAVPMLFIFMLDAFEVEGNRRSARYVAVVFACWKVGISYWLYFLQSRSFELYAYYGGILRSGVIAVVAGYVLERMLITSIGGNFTLRLLFG